MTICDVHVPSPQTAHERLLNRQVTTIFEWC
jgi:hypothetical protein